jgi:hypothetical protein
LQDLKEGNGVLMISAALTRPAVNMQLMLFEAESCKGSGSNKQGELAWIAPAAAKSPCIGGFKRGKQLGQVWRYMQPSRDYPSTLWSYYGVDFDGSVRTRDAKTDKVLSKHAVQAGRQYKFQLWLLGPLAAADKAAGEDYKTWQVCGLLGLFLWVVFKKQHAVLKQQPMQGVLMRLLLSMPVLYSYLPASCMATCHCLNRRIVQLINAMLLLLLLLLLSPLQYDVPGTYSFV